MKEKVLIQSEKYSAKKFLIAVIVIALVSALVMLGIRFSVAKKEIEEHTHGYYCYSQAYKTHYYSDYSEPAANKFYEEHGYDADDRDRYMAWIYSDEYISLDDYFNLYGEGHDDWCECYESKGLFAYWAFTTYANYYFIYASLIAGGVLLLGVLILLWLNSYSLSVSDKYVSGKLLWGKKVDLPLDSISAISVISLLKGVGIFTSSGKINFYAIKNAGEIYTVINDLLIKRQEQVEKANVNAPVEDETEKILKYKALLDSGVITQEEFEAKKKQLLGL